MSTRGVVGILVGLVLLLIVAYYSIPNPGKKALQQEEIAVSEVSSWRISTEISKDGRPKLRRTYAALCPDKEHILERNLGDLAEYIRIGDDIFYRKNSYQWVKGTPGPDLFQPLPMPRPCLSNPGEPASRPPGGAEEMRLALETDIKDGHIEKGEKKSSNGSACQEWSITRFTESNRLGNYVICLNETDNLPRYIRDANENFRMSFEWDPSLTIEPPDVNSPGKMPTSP
jgi:hypothetical protein